MARYSDDFRSEVIAAAQNSNKPRSAIARYYGIAPSTLSRWMQQYTIPKTDLDSEDEPPKIGRIRIRGREGGWKEIHPKRRETGDPELDTLWEMSFDELAAINKDPDHPLHEKSKQVGREIMAPLGEAAKNLYRPAIQPIIDQMRKFAEISRTPGWSSDFAAQIAPYAGINDIMKSIAERTNIGATFTEAVRAQLPEINLIPKINLISPFTADSSIASVVAGFKPQLDSIYAWQTERFRSFTEDAKWLLLLGVYPPNWHSRALDPVDADVLRPLLRDEGIVLAWAPDTDTLVQLLDADSAEERKQILAHRKSAIAEHCQNALEAAPSGELDEARLLAISAVEALQAGHHQAAQALATNVLEACINERLPRKERNILVNRKSGSAFEREEAFRAAMVFDAVNAAYAQEYRPNRGIPVPTSYSRHATAHSTSLEQYTPLNALLAIMHATAIVMLFAHQLNVKDLDDMEEIE